MPVSCEELALVSPLPRESDVTVVLNKVDRTAEPEKTVAAGFTLRLLELWERQKSPDILSTFWHNPWANVMSKTRPQRQRKR